MLRVILTFAALALGAVGLVLASFGAIMQLDALMAYMSATAAPYWLLVVLGALLLFAAAATTAWTRLGAGALGGIVLLLALLAVVPMPMGAAWFPPLMRLSGSTRLAMGGILVLSSVGLAIGTVLLVGAVVGRRTKPATVGARVLAVCGGLLASAAVLATAFGSGAMADDFMRTFSFPGPMAVAALVLSVVLLALGVLPALRSSLGLAVAAGLTLLATLLVTFVGLNPDARSLAWGVFGAASGRMLLTLAPSGILLLPAAAFGGLALGTKLRSVRSAQAAPVQRPPGSVPVTTAPYASGAAPVQAGAMPWYDGASQPGGGGDGGGGGGGD